MKTHCSRLSLALAVAGLGLFGTALASEETAQSEVSGEIVGACTIAADNADFGQVPVSEAGTTIDRTVNLTVNCSTAVMYQVAVASEAPWEYATNLDIVNGNPPATGTLNFASNTLTLANGASPVGTVGYWADAGKSTPFEVGVPVTSRAGTGSDETIPVTLAWTLPDAGSLQGNSFVRWKLTNTYKVVF